jgi:hypothetical protein
LSDAVKINSTTAVCTKKEVEIALQKWFGNCRDRHGGKKQRLIKAAANRIPTVTALPNLSTTTLPELELPPLDLP